MFLRARLRRVPPSDTIFDFPPALPVTTRRMVILVLPCGWGIERTRAEMDPLTSRPGWPRLRAVRDGRVYLADGNQYFNRPGPRLAESLEILAEMLHPGKIHFGHEGSGWIKL